MRRGKAWQERAEQGKVGWWDAHCFAAPPRLKYDGRKEEVEEEGVVESQPLSAGNSSGQKDVVLRACANRLLPPPLEKKEATEVEVQSCKHLT